MRMRDLQRLFKYWSRVPPAHELMAMERGLEVGPAAAKRSSSPADIQGFLDAIGAVRG